MHLSSIDKKFLMLCKRRGVHLLSFCAFRFLWSDWGFAWSRRLLSNRADKAKALSGCLGPEDDCGALLCVLVLDAPVWWAVLSTLAARTKEGWLLETEPWDLYLVGPVGGQHEERQSVVLFFHRQWTNHSLVAFNQNPLCSGTGLRCPTVLKCMWNPSTVRLFNMEKSPLQPQ